jgi:hypothetical protein
LAILGLDIVSFNILSLSAFVPAGHSLLSLGSKHQLLIINLTAVPGRRFSKSQHRQALYVICHCMRSTSIIISFLFLFGCNSRTIKTDQIESLPKNSRSRIVKLIDSLGTVTINIPSRYDSFFQWTNTSDCGKSCDHEQYRFQPKYLPVFKESGFFYTIPANVNDSTEQFTIVHSGYFPFHEGSDSSLVYKINDYQKQNLLTNPATHKIASDTVQNINGRYFSIVTIDLFDPIKKIYSKRVIGSTAIKGNGIEFKYELLTKATDSTVTNFIKNSIDLLKTARLSNGI